MSTIDDSRSGSVCLGADCQTRHHHNQLDDADAEVDSLREQLRRVTEERDSFKADYEGACRALVDVYEAATGRKGLGPKRGLVEDALEVRLALELARAALAGRTP